LTVCGAHHRALHRGEVAVEGGAAGSSFRNADGSFYGGVANPKILDSTSKLFSALRGLGFRGAEVRGARELRGREEMRGGPIQDWLRAALQWLTGVQATSARARERLCLLQLRCSWPCLGAQTTGSCTASGAPPSLAQR